MKCIAAVFAVLLLLSGCTAGHGELDSAMQLREQILKSSGCEFAVKITADYGDDFYTFEMACQADAVGELSFQVLKPESISGISGKLSETGGALTFEDQVLAFELLADGQVTPVCGPWLLIHSLRSGYIRACGKVEDGIHIQIDDSYAEAALQTDIWLSEDGDPVRCEIVWDGRRILSMDVENFVIM